MSAHQGKFVAYFRVSTDRQGKSGLGLEAQRKSALDYLDGGRWELVAEFAEVESGTLRKDCSVKPPSTAPSRLELEAQLGTFFLGQPVRHLWKNRAIERGAPRIPGQRSG